MVSRTTLGNELASPLRFQNARPVAIRDFGHMISPVPNVSCRPARLRSRAVAPGRKTKTADRSKTTTRNAAAGATRCGVVDTGWPMRPARDWQALTYSSSSFEAETHRPFAMLAMLSVDILRSDRVPRHSYASCSITEGPAFTRASS